MKVTYVMRQPGETSSIFLWHTESGIKPAGVTAAAFMASSCWLWLNLIGNVRQYRTRLLAYREGRGAPPEPGH